MDKEKDTAKDSGISQMLKEKQYTIEERIDELLNFSKDFISDIIKKKEQGHNKIESAQGAAYNEESEALFAVFERLQLEKRELETSVQDCKAALTNVRHMIRNGSVSAVIDMLKDLLETLEYIWATNENRLKSTALGVLTEMLNNRKVGAHLANFVELTEFMVLGVLTSYSDPNKEISRAAKHCVLAIVANVPAPHLIGVLGLLIKTGDFPINLAAVKILTKVMESNAREVIQPYIDYIMEVLLQAFDHPEISVRKSAAFCAFALGAAVGQVLVYNPDSSEPVIAPSGSNTPAAPELPSLPVLQTEIAPKVPEVLHEPERENVTQTNNVQENVPTQLLKTVPPPPPPPPPPKEKYENETDERTVETTHQESNSLPKDGLGAEAGGGARD